MKLGQNTPTLTTVNVRAHQRKVKTVHPITEAPTPSPHEQQATRASLARPCALSVAYGLRAELDRLIALIDSGDSLAAWKLAMQDDTLNVVKLSDALGLDAEVAKHVKQECWQFAGAHQRGANKALAAYLAQNPNS